MNGEKITQSNIANDIYEKAQENDLITSMGEIAVDNADTSRDDGEQNSYDYYRTHTDKEMFERDGVKMQAHYFVGTYGKVMQEEVSREECHKILESDIRNTYTNPEPVLDWIRSLEDDSVYEIKKIGLLKQPGMPAESHTLISQGHYSFDLTRKRGGSRPWRIYFTREDGEDGEFRLGSDRFIRRID